MKKLTKIVVATMAMTMLFATPVLATEGTLSAESDMLSNKMNRFSNDVTTLVSFDNNCGDAAANSMHVLVDAVDSDVVKSNVAEQQNYIKYLEAKVGNAIETERIKKQNVAALTDLCKVNPTFSGQLDAAVAEYDQAVADHAAAVQAVADAKAYFDALNASFKDAALTKAVGDTQAIIK